MTMTKKIKKGIVEAPKEPRAFTANEILEIQELHRVASAERFKATQVKGNTAMVPDGQKLAEQMDAIARLMENFKNNYISSKLAECGYTPSQKVNIDLKTGQIILQ